MDYAEHERTYQRFRLFTEIGIVHVLCLVLVVGDLGMSSIQAAVALFGFVLTLATTIVGAFAPALSWRPLAGLLVLLLLILLYC